MTDQSQISRRREHTHSPTPMRALSVLTFALALTACGDASGDSPPATGGSDAVVSSGNTYEKAIKDSPCDLVTAAMVADALGVPEDDVVYHEEAARYASDTCMYLTTDDSDRTAYVAVRTVSDDAGAAATRFDGTYRAQTEEDMARAKAAGDAAVEQQIEAGTLDRETADGLGAGDMFSNALSKMNYTAADVGDQSVTSRTSQLFDGVYVRDGNLIFHVLVDASAADLDPRSVTPEMIAEAEKNVEPSLALARAIIAAQ